MFLTAAKTLARWSGRRPGDGRIYPALSKIREVSLKIATAVAEEVHREGWPACRVPPTLRPTSADACSSRFIATTSDASIPSR